MRRITLLLVGMLALFSTTAQRKNFTYKFYGFVRGDLFYNSRANMAPIDGNFYLYPLDKSFDADGKDLNATPNGSFYTFTSRLGLDVTGPDIGKARSSAKIETDFGGFSGSNTMLRIRQAYVNLDWGKSAVLVGITWHPLFGAVMPDVLNLSTGAPFQPFNRSPQIRCGRNYTFAAKTLMASALDHTALLGGYGVSSVDSRTGEQGYTPFRHSTTWVNFAYGTKWRPGVFVGYTKNLGTGKSLVSADKVYGMGLDIDQLITVSLNVSYNLPHWKFGFEYCPATAYYGTTDLESGRIEQTHAITNHRILGLMMYYF